MNKQQNKLKRIFIDIISQKSVLHCAFLNIHLQFAINGSVMDTGLY